QRGLPRPYRLDRHRGTGRGSTGEGHGGARARPAGTYRADCSLPGRTGRLLRPNGQGAERHGVESDARTWHRGPLDPVWAGGAATMMLESPHDYRRFSLVERDRRWKAVRELMARD